MKKYVLVCIACSGIAGMVASPVCASITIPDGCQECSTKHTKNMCEVTCKACYRADGMLGQADTTVQFELTDNIEDISIVVDENGELEIAE